MKALRERITGLGTYILLLLNQYVSSVPYVDPDIVQEILYLFLLQFPHFDKRFEMVCLEDDFI
jgi:hypothetical protein